MQFDDDKPLDPSQVEDVRASGPRPGGGFGRMPGGCMLPIGGKGGGCLLLVLAVAAMFLFGIIPTPFTGDPGEQGDPGVQGGGRQPSAPATGNLAERCRTGADADQSEDCRVVGTVNSIQDYWKGQIPGYRPAKTVLFTRAVRTGCGAADSAVGPFYCPADQRVYLDLTFFDTLQRDFGAEGGPFAQAYVIAHEIGHHLQNLTGTLDQVRQGQQAAPGQANALSVALELQADCYAGVWAASADARGVLEAGDFEEGLTAAAAVGDDRLSDMAGRAANQETFTHGSSEQRMRWFSTGYQSGDPNACDTFASGF